MKLEAKQRLTNLPSMSFQKWKTAVLKRNPKAKLTYEDGSGKTYGDEGGWTAHVGPDMQADVVGTYSWENDLCWYSDGKKGEHKEFGTEGTPVKATLEDPTSTGQTFDLLVDGGPPDDHTPLVQRLTNDDGGVAPPEEQHLLNHDLPYKM